MTMMMMNYWWYMQRRRRTSCGHCHSTDWTACNDPQASSLNCRSNVRATRASVSASSAARRRSTNSLCHRDSAVTPTSARISTPAIYFRSIYFRSQSRWQKCTRGRQESRWPAASVSVRRPPVDLSPAPTSTCRAPLPLLCPEIRRRQDDRLNWRQNSDFRFRNVPRYPVALFAGQCRVRWGWLPTKQLGRWTWKDEEEEEAMSGMIVKMNNCSPAARVQSSGARSHRRRSSAFERDVDLRGEVVTDLPVALRAQFPEFEPEALNSSSNMPPRPTFSDRRLLPPPVVAAPTDALSSTAVGSRVGFGHRYAVNDTRFLFPTSTATRPVISGCFTPPIGRCDVKVKCMRWLRDVERHEHQ